MNRSSSNKKRVSLRNDRDRTITPLRVPGGLAPLIEAWAAKQADRPGFPEAVARLLRLGLAEHLGKRTTKTSKSVKASALAEHEVDRQADQTASAEERSHRKKRLIEGPAEFRESRVDQRAHANRFDIGEKDD